MIDPLTRRKLIKAGALAGVAVGGLGVSNRGPIATHHKIYRPGVGARFRIAHLTDIHVGWTTPEAVLVKAQQLTQRAQPDLVVLTGDYVNRSLDHLERLKRFVKGLPGPIIATLGNHDHWSGKTEIVQALEQNGAEVLSNQNTVFHSLGLTVVGVDDGRTKHHDVQAAFKGVKRPDAAIVLSHCPSTADEIAQRGGLILSGHTHGGQVAIPLLTNALVKSLGVPYTAGWYPLNGPGRSALYVSAGLGHSRKGLRYGRAAMAEVAVIDIVPDEGAALRGSTA